MQDQQLSLFGQQIPMPQTIEDVAALWRDRIRERPADDGAFTYAPITCGFSVSFFGVKVFEFIPAGAGPEGSNPAKLRLPGDAMRAIRLTRDGMIDDHLYTAADLTPAQMDALADFLRERKRAIFRDLAPYQFGCCHAFVQCSDARACLFPDDTFFNGCQYRQHLEAGRIFYGKNANCTGGPDQ